MSIRARNTMLEAELYADLAKDFVNQSEEVRDSLTNSELRARAHCYAATSLALSNLALAMLEYDKT